MKKYLSLLLSVALVVGLLAGCGTGKQSSEKGQKENGAPGGKVFRYGFLDEPPGVDPSISQGDVQSTIYAALYEGLVTCDPEGNIIPGCAESWETNADQTEYIFTLREGLNWSDGKPLTAQDFVYSWLRVLEPATASTYSWFVQMFLKNATAYSNGEVGAEEVGVKAADERTLIVTLEQPASYFLQALLQGCWLPVRQDMVEKDPDKWCFNAETCITNGPFRFTEYKIGSYISAVKNENYWDAESIQIEELKLNFIADANTALSAFEAGDLDAIAGVPATEIVNLMTSDDRLHTYDKLSFSFLRLNTKIDALSDARVRRAISLAISRQEYLDGLGNITSVPALGVVPEGMLLDGKDFREVSGDNGLKAEAQVQEAQKLMAEAGYAEGQGFPVLRIHCTEANLKGAEIIQQMLKNNIGIETEIHPVDDKLNFPTMVEGNYDIGFSGWGGDYTHPMTFLQLFTSSAYDNCTGWANTEFDALLEQAQTEADEAKALEVMTEAEHILMEEAPCVPLNFPSGAIMVQDYVSDWFISASNVFYLSHAQVNR